MSAVTQPAERRDASRIEPIRIVIADDSVVVRRGLRAHIMAQSGLAVIGEAADGEQAWACARALRPDVLLLDLSMPGVGGIEAAQRIAADYPDVRIIVLTIHEERSYVALLMRAGVAGYVLKRTAAGSLIRAIRAVAAGGSFIDPAVADDAGIDAPIASPSEPRDAVAGSGDLTEREGQLLLLIAQGRSNGEIAATLGLSIAAVALDRSSGMSKLGLHTRAALVRHATERGWLKLEH
jgi:DNA-binding NarL/FixJ family response regulator